MIRRWRTGLRSRLLVIHLEIPGATITAHGLVRSWHYRILLIDRGLL